MGLDMHLYKKTYIGGNYDWNKVSGVIDISTHGMKPDIKLERVTYITEEIGYWRKVNHIHRWFVENIQGGEDDCNEYIVPLDKLHELKTICEKVMADHTLAPSLLPTEDGFFFGSTDYDEYYFNDVAETIKILDSALKELGVGSDLSAEDQNKLLSLVEFTYMASW